MASEAEVMEEAESQTSGQRPVARFNGSGGLSVAVWKHKVEGGYDQYSVRLDRSYKVEDGYQSTPYLRADDLLRATALLQQADAWIEQAKGRQATPGAAVAR